MSVGRQRDQMNHNINNLLSNFQEPQSTAPQQTSQAQQQPTRLPQSYGGTLPDSPATTPEQAQGSQMNDLDRFGLAGLLANVRSENPDVAGLAIGQDLNHLGLNLNSVE